MDTTTRRRRNSSECHTLMPVLTKDSETESAKGSCDQVSSVAVAPVPVPGIAFPSLPNTFLAKLGVHKDSPLSVDAFHEKDLERKFTSLSLAFKTDCLTLSKRLDLHKRQRDTAEQNVKYEFQSIRDHLNPLSFKTKRCGVQDLLSKIQTHLDVAEQAASRVSARSETYGAVQQEERVCKAFQVLMLHVDHLKRSFDKEHKELEETKLMLTDTRVFRKDVTTEVLSEEQKKYSKTFGLPVGSIKSIGRRRASVADFQSRSFLENCQSPGFSQSWTFGSSGKTLEPTPTVQSTDPPATLVVPPPLARAPTSRRRNSLQSDESNQTVLPQKTFGIKEERNSWSRKLSSVTDEKEQSEDESEPEKIPEKPVQENPSERRTLNQEQFLLRDFLKQVELKNNQQYESFENCDDGVSDFTNETSYVDEIYDFIVYSNILSQVQNFFVGNYSYILAMQEIWKQNNSCTLLRYFCSSLLAFVALCFFLSLILPLIGVNLNI